MERFKIYDLDDRREPIFVSDEFSLPDDLLLSYEQVSPEQLFKPRRLFVEFCVRTEADVTSVAEIVAKLPHIDMLDIRGWSDVSLTPIYDQVRSCRHLSVTLDGPAAVLDGITALLIRVPISELFLYNVMTTTESIDTFLNMLASNVTLNQITLSCCTLAAPTLPMLLPYVSSLTIRCSTVDPAFLTSLFTNLVDNECLRNLNLEATPLTASSLAVLASSLTINTTLESLNLNDLELIDGMTPLLEALVVNTTLERLSIGGKLWPNNTTYHTLARTLRLNKGISDLFLSFENLSQAGVSELFSSLTNNTTLKSLQCIGFKAEHENAFPALETMLQRNHTLTQTNFMRHNPKFKVVSLLLDRNHHNQIRDSALMSMLLDKM